MKTQIRSAKGNAEEWACANDLHQRKGTARWWLRELWKQGKIRRRSLTVRGPNGESREKYLYSVDDVERELSKTEEKGGV